MKVHQYGDGLWRWSVGERTSAYIEHGDVMILVDPLLPPDADDAARFRRAICRAHDERNRAQMSLDHSGVKVSRRGSRSAQCDGRETRDLRLED